jgi:hypothetical protein
MSKLTADFADFTDFFMTVYCAAIICIICGICGKNRTESAVKIGRNLLFALHPNGVCLRLWAEGYFITGSFCFIYRAKVMISIEKAKKWAFLLCFAHFFVPLHAIFLGN